MKLNSAKTIVSSFLFTGMMAVPGIASADKDPVPVAGCGAGWELITVEKAIGIIDWRIYSGDERLEIEGLVRGQDENADGHLCAKQWKPNQGQDKHWGITDYGQTNYVVTGTLDNKAQGRIR